MGDEGQYLTTRRLYLELTARLIEREITQFTSGTQAAHESFTKVAKLVRNASEELACPGARARARPATGCIRAALDFAQGVPRMSRPRSSDIDRFLGYRLKALRLACGMTQQQVARQVGVSNQQMHKFEKGINRVSAGQLLAFAQTFDIPMAAVFDGYDRGAPRDLLVDPKSSRMLLNFRNSFLELEPKCQDALMRLARAMAIEG
jgi:transcriptional regulator with XRE-family HTH domain